MINKNLTTSSQPEDFSQKRRARFSIIFYRSLILLWSTICCVAITSWLFSSQALFRLEGNKVTWTDFIAFYQSGLMVLSADRREIYNLHSQLDWFNRIIYPLHSQNNPGILYPPTLIVLTPLLTIVPAQTSYILTAFLFLGIGIFSLCPWLKQNGIKPLNKLVFLAAVFCSLPGLKAIYMGQISWLFCALVAGYFWSLRKEEPIKAGLCLGLLSCKPHYFVFFLIAAAALKQWKTIATATAVSLFLVLMAGLILGFDCFIQYPKYLFEVSCSTKEFNIMPQAQMNIRAVLHGITSPETALFTSNILSVLSMAATFMIWQRFRKANNASAYPWCMAASILLAVTGNSHSHAYDCLLIAIPAAATFYSLRWNNLFAARPRALNLWFICLAIYPLTSLIYVITQAKLPGFWHQLLMLLNLTMLGSCLFILGQDLSISKTKET